MKTLLLLIGIAAGIYGLAEAKTGHGIIFGGWLLLPPRSYAAGILSLLCLVVAAFLLGRGRKTD